MGLFEFYNTSNSEKKIISDKIKELIQLSMISRYVLINNFKKPICKKGEFEIVIFSTTILLGIYRRKYFKNEDFFEDEFIDGLVNLSNLFLQNDFKKTTKKEIEQIVTNSIRLYEREILNYDEQNFASDVLYEKFYVNPLREPANSIKKNNIFNNNDTYKEYPKGDFLYTVSLLIEFIFETTAQDDGKTTR